LRSEIAKLRALTNGRVLAVGFLLLVCQLCAAQQFSYRDVSEHLDNLTVYLRTQPHTCGLWVGTDAGLFLQRHKGSFTPVAAIGFGILPQWWQDRAKWVGLAMLALLAMIPFVPRWMRLPKVLPPSLLEDASRMRIEALEREKDEMLRSREQLRYFAEHDDLTGLWNHRMILERLRIEVERARRDRLPLSIVMVDLDHFKLINDCHGHPAGDHVLREVALIFLNSIRSYDWVGRYGGEEFLIVLPSSSFIGVRERTEQLRVALQDTRMTFNGKPIQITASFGVASGFPSSYEAMIQLADAALYRAKDNGRNCSIAVEIEPSEEPQMKRG
jgi:diguanylate cyclase (GGDEF)-like protein